MKTEVRAADGRRHATALDVVQLDVVTAVPPGMGTCTPTPTPTITGTATRTPTPSRTPTPTSTPTLVPPDLTVSHLEVNQAVQNEANSIPLIADKRTVVRASIAIGLPAGPVGGVTGRLKGYRGMTLLGTVAPFNPGGSITAYKAPDWRQINHTLNFEVPFAWLTGDVRLEVEVNPNRSVVESDTSNNTTSVNVTFVDGGGLRVAWLPIHYVTGGYTGPAGPHCADYQGRCLAESDLPGQSHPGQVLPLARDHLGRQHQHRHRRDKAAQLSGAAVPTQPDQSPARPCLRLAADQRLSWERSGVAARQDRLW